MAGQRRNVAGPFPERRQLDRHDVDPVIEVLAEFPLLDQLDKIMVGGGDDPDIELDHALAADAVDLAGLERAQQAGLGVHRHVADLVKKQRAALGLLEFARRAGDGAGEGALFVAEQFRLDQLRRNRRHIDRDERAVFPVPETVDGLGHQFLAGAGFAQDQHGEVILEEAGDHPVNVLHRRAAPDQRQAFLVHRRFDRLDILRFQRLPDHLDQFVQIKRLGQIFEGAGFRRADGGIESVLGGNDDDRDVRVSRLDRAQRGNAVALAFAQSDIGEQQVVAAARHQRVAFGDRLAVLDLIAFGAQGRDDDVADRQIVFHQYDFFLGHDLSCVQLFGATGRNRVNLLISS